MKHYKLGEKEPAEWPFWHDLLICGAALAVIFALLR